MTSLLEPPTGANFTTEIHKDTYAYIDPKKLDLTGKRILITGASRGVGKAMAVSFGKAGASGIVLLARSDLSGVQRDVQRAASESGRPKPDILAINADATSLEDVNAAAKKVEQNYGDLDVLINNAGYLEEFKPLGDSDPVEWWKTFEINVKGVYLMTRAFLPLVLKSRDKTIIQISSIGAHLISPGASSYQTTKQAVLRLNDFLMMDYGKQGLLAYGIHPGGVMTDLASRLPKESHSALTETPELCGDTIAWLTKEKRDWLADRYVSVTWDMKELLAKKDEIVKNNLLTVRLRL